MSYAADRFRLTRYFTIASLIAFTVVGFALFALERQEEAFFEQVQAEQTTFFSQVQLELSGQQEDKARRELLAVHEAGHENLTRFLANVLWEKNIAPFMAKVQRIPDDHCRVMHDTPATEPMGEVSARHACFAEVGRRIMELPAFSTLDVTAYAAMRSSTVFKIKVFDLRGITVYSSEHTQVGEDKSDNLGWKSAVGGRPASELTHRDKFSAFEGVVENRDLISSYVPVRTPGGDRVMGVFEIYSDVTPFLGQINSASARIREITKANQAKVEHAARENEQKVHSSSKKFLAIVGGLLAMLYAVLFFLVRNGQRIIDQQSRAQEQATQREQLWHREKMAALSTMAKHVSHELGNPLATIAGLAEDIADRQGDGRGGANQPKLILEQTQRIAAMIRQIADFAAARSEKPEIADINQMVAAIRDFLSFDVRFQSTRIEFRPDLQLPACVVIPDSLNEVLMDLMQACVESELKPARILIETKIEGARVEIHIVCEPVSAVTSSLLTGSSKGVRFDSAKRRVRAMGGQLMLGTAGIRIALPAA